jgi:hypothetical protein
LRDSWHLTGLARLSGVALGFELLNLFRDLGLARCFTVSPVWAAVFPDAHSHPAVPYAVAAEVNR